MRTISKTQLYYFISLRSRLHSLYKSQHLRTADMLDVITKLVSDLYVTPRAVK